MKNPCSSVARSWLPAVGLVLAVAMSQAAFAAKITQAQQDKVKFGMTADEIRQVLGNPVEVNRVRYSPGPTWVYEFGDEGSVKHFEVDFDGNGKVMWIQRHDLPGR